MGLAASQARLISLQARMSDLEYEGQQINQQRQTLTNKMNEVYSAAMDMEVPTAPSKIDFQIDAYTGKVGTQKVNLKLNDQGKWVGTMTKSAMTAGMSFTSAQYNRGAIDGGVGDGKEYIERNDLNPQNASEMNALIGNVIIKDADGNIKVLSAEDIETADESGSTLKPNYKFVQRNPNVNQAKIGDNELKGIAELRAEDHSKAFEDAVKGLKNYVNERIAANDPNFTAKEFNEADYRCYVDSDGNYKFTPVNGTKVNLDSSAQPALISSVLDKEAQVSVSVESWDLDNSGNITSFTIKENDGTVSKLPVTHSTDAYDEVKYDEAMRNYEKDKIEYDKAQNDFNHQTSIYQRQDKQLELKLTRLDNERNALNTEIDSVKKVIQDASEKGFKTFSG